MREEKRHWSNEELLARLYGVDVENAGAEHLEECAECAGRWRQLLIRRAAAVSQAAEASISDERLRSQRAAVWARIDRRPAVWLWKWVPAGAAAGVVGLGLLLLSPALAPHKGLAPAAQTRISDEQLFADVAVLSSPEAPRGAAPIRELFEERNESEEEVAF